MYEYRCPECQAVNTRHERMCRLVCARCGHEWEPGGSGVTITAPDGPIIWPTWPQTPPVYPWEPWVIYGSSTADPQPVGSTICSN